MRCFSRHAALAAASALFLLPLAAPAQAASYWNVFNFEEEAAQPAVIVTYATRADMLADANRTGLFIQDDPFAGPNLIDSGSDGSTYWNLFNFEGEAAQPAVFATYATLEDMLLDQNRVDLFIQDDPFAGPNLIGGGTDGSTYWNVFNFEEEAAQPAVIVTYATLADMLNDDNRTGLFIQDDPFAGPNLIDSGSDGSTYWNLFNFEGEAAQPAVFATYATLMDMLLDQNRTGLFIQDDPFAGPNLIGGGTDNFRRTTPVPEPAVWASMILGFGFSGALLRRRRRAGYSLRSAPLPA